MGQFVSTAWSFINYKYVRETSFHTHGEICLITNKTSTNGRWDILNATSHNQYVKLLQSITTLLVSHIQGTWNSKMGLHSGNRVMGSNPTCKGFCVRFSCCTFFFHCIFLGSLVCSHSPKMCPMTTVRAVNDGIDLVNTKVSIWWR